MQLARIAAAGWTVATLAVVGDATTACGGDHTSSPASSSSTSSSAATASSGSVTNPSPGQPTDYSSLLIKAGDIGGDFTTPQPPVQNPNNAAGVAQLYTRPDNTRRIGVTILIVADPAVVPAGIENTKNNYAGKVSGTWQPVDVGANGFMISGNSRDNSVTVLLFSEGKAIANLEFDSAPNDPIDPNVVIDVGRKQDAAIKAGLPG